jgi:DNA-directed RNA polymerase subunit alpha
MSVRLHKCLREAQCDTLADVAQKTEWELIKIRHLGRKTLQELKLEASITASATPIAFV